MLDSENIRACSMARMVFQVQVGNTHKMAIFIYREHYVRICAQHFYWTVVQPNIFPGKEGIRPFFMLSP